MNPYVSALSFVSLVYAINYFVNEQQRKQNTKKLTTLFRKALYENGKKKYLTL